MKVKLSKFFKKLFSSHKHQWVLITRTISEPKNINAGGLVAQLPQEFADKLVFGLTTYVWECEECGELRKQECLGTEETSLDEILNRVDMYGSQQVTKDNKNYVVVPQAKVATQLGQVPIQPRIPIRQP